MFDKRLKCRHKLLKNNIFENMQIAAAAASITETEVIVDNL